MSVDTDPLVWSVDRSWGNVKANSDGTMYPSDYRKYHVDRGDSTAKCHRRIFLNSLRDSKVPGMSGAGGFGDDAPAGRASELAREDVCRRCVPVMPGSTEP